MYTDEFEFEAKNGNTYYIAVNFNAACEIMDFSTKDHLGEEVSDDEIIAEVKEEVENKEYGPEHHGATFDFYEQQLDHFGEDKLF